MAIHADLRGRDICIRGCLDGGMAVTAIDAETTYVVLVTEGNGLLTRNVLHHFVWRPNNHGGGPEHETKRRNDGEQAEPGDCVRASRKILRHFLALQFRAH